MKGLRKIISPFAPDQSGASAVFYALGGIIVICDAGGCTGNICGFDEPRWFTHKSAIFSAGLRDMDAIMGRDELLAEKLKSAMEKLGGRFAAIIGTPVPAVVGTDYRGLGRMAEKKTGKPVLAVDTNGMELYDIGTEKAYLSLLKRFSTEALPVQSGRIGVFGLTPLDFGNPDDQKRFTEKLREKGAQEIFFYGNGILDEFIEASSAEKNIVAAPSGLKAAEYLKNKFGTPYECTDLLAEDCVQGIEAVGKRILVIHQQIRANGIRECLEKKGAAVVSNATWFMQSPKLKRDGDIRLNEEDQFIDLIREGHFDLVIGDQSILDAVPDGMAEKFDLPHFAVSGRTEKPWIE